MKRAGCAIWGLAPGVKPQVRARPTFPPGRTPARMCSLVGLRHGGDGVRWGAKWGEMVDLGGRWGLRWGPVGMADGRQHRRTSSSTAGRAERKEAAGVRWQARTPARPQGSAGLAVSV